MNTRNIIVIATAILAVLVGGVVMMSRDTQIVIPDEQLEKLADVVTSRVQANLGEATTFDELQLGNTITDIHTITITSGTSTAAWRNTTGQDVWITDWQAVALGTASSSFRLFAATSTIAATNTFIWHASDTATKFGPGYNPFAIPLTNQASCILCGMFIATSSTANVRSSDDPLDIRYMPGVADLDPPNLGQFATTGAIFANFGSSTASFDEATSSPRVWRVRPLEYVQLYLRQEGAFSFCNGRNNAICEPATSTARGFNPVFTFKTIATTTTANDSYPLN